MSVMRTITQYRSQFRLDMYYKCIIISCLSSRGKRCSKITCYDALLIHMANKENLLVVDDMTMAIEVLDPKILDVLKTKETCLDPNYNVQFFQKRNIDDLLNRMLLGDQMPYGQSLCFEAKETEKLASLVNYRKGCGKWIDTSKGCPFSSAAGLVATEMTVNENRIIELWQRMCSMFSAIA